MAKKPEQKPASEMEIDEILGPVSAAPKKKRGKINLPTDLATPKAEMVAKEKADKPKTEKVKSDKPKEPKEPRKLKGEMVTFKNKKGETIVGMGQLYFCVQIKGKLHYKQFDAVEVLDPNFTL